MSSSDGLVIYGQATKQRPPCTMSEPIQMKVRLSLSMARKMEGDTTTSIETWIGICLERHFGEGSMPCPRHQLWLLGRQVIGHHIDQGLHVRLAKLVNGDGYAQVPAQEVHQLTWEQVLHKCHLVFWAADGSELTFAYVCIQPQYASKYLHDSTH
jgi:hypothetical protein